MAQLGLGKKKYSIIEAKREVISHRGNRKSRGRYLSGKLQQGKLVDQRMKANNKEKDTPGGEIYDHICTKGGEKTVKIIDLGQNHHPPEHDKLNR
jgi:hypothetical protein